MCFGGGGGGGSSAPAQEPPPPKDTPTPAGSDANQRFQQIRANFLEPIRPATVLDPTSGNYGNARGATVLGTTS